MARYGLGLLPYFPLASGLLTGKHKRGGDRAGTRLAMPTFAGIVTDANFDKVEKLEAFAQARGHTILQLAFSWLAARPTVGSIIAGATRPEQIDANVQAAGWALSAEDLEEIDKITAAG
jgi:aryl-alcohol dehydrogenase-like predicted oxidoreductase